MDGKRIETSFSSKEVIFEVFRSDVSQVQDIDRRMKTQSEIKLTLQFWM